MRLVQPTDFDILESLSNGKRNNAINIAVMLDRKRSYINTRLPVLEDYELVDSVGPASNSGLYVITNLGESAVVHRDQYSNDVDFEKLIG